MVRGRVQDEEVVEREGAEKGREQCVDGEQARLAAPEVGAAELHLGVL